MGFSRQEYADCKLKKEKNKLLFGSFIFSYSMQQQQQTISQLDYRLTQLVTTSSVPGQRRSSRALPQSKLAPKKKKKKGHGHCLVVCCQSAPLQLSESWWNHNIWEVCSANWWDAPKTAMPAASIGQQKGPNSSPQQPLTTCSATNASKVERIGPQSFASSATLTWPLVIRLPLLQGFWQLFLQGKPFHNQEAENAFQEFLES